MKELKCLWSWLVQRVESEQYSQNDKTELDWRLNLKSGPLQLSGLKKN